MKKLTIGIIDYGCGNLRSILNMIDAIGHKYLIVSQANDFSKVNSIILPGVGAFPKAMEFLKLHNLDKAIIEFSKNKSNTIVGICLGMQIFADISYEYQETKGLGLIPGEIHPLASPMWNLGWNKLGLLEEYPWINSISLANEYFYFNHSFHLKTDKKYILATANIGKEVVAIVNKNNIFGFQFHPEISQISGFRMMKNLYSFILKLSNKQVQCNKQLGFEYV